MLALHGFWSPQSGLCLWAEDSGPVVTLDAGAALAALSERAPGVRYGASLGYLADVAAFAGELVSRGRVLPALIRDQAGAFARWRPFLQGPDAVAMHALAGAMPPV